MNWIRLKLPEELRGNLKKPLGELISGSENIIYKRILSIIKENEPTKIISVGDRVSRFLLENKIKVDVSIIDQRENRVNSPYPLIPRSKNVFYASNAPGHIEINAWNAVDEALKTEDSTIIIKGEEDLLVIAVAYLAQENTLIFYGQPGKGIVAIKNSKKFKLYIEKEFINQMIVEKPVPQRSQ